MVKVNSYRAQQTNVYETTTFSDGTAVKKDNKNNPDTIKCKQLSSFFNEKSLHKKLSDTINMLQYTQLHTYKGPLSGTKPGEPVPER